MLERTTHIVANSACDDNHIDSSQTREVVDGGRQEIGLQDLLPSKIYRYRSSGDTMDNRDPDRTEFNYLHCGKGLILQGAECVSLLLMFHYINHGTAEVENVTTDPEWRISKLWKYL
jgi:hypothetical protein